LLLSFFLLLPSCSGNRGERPVVIKAASVCPPSNPIVMTFHFIKREIEKRSQGRVRVEIYDSGQLGGETDNVERIRLNTLEMADVSTAVLGNFAPDFFVFDLPFIFSGREHQAAVLDGPVGRLLLEKLRPIGIRGMMFYGGVSRNLYAKRPVRTLEDLKGLKVRIMESRVMQQTWSAFGATAIPLSFSELYSALEQGVVDGAENNIVQYYVSGHNDPCPYYILTGHFMVPSIIILSDRFFERLGSPDRRLLEEVFADSRVYYDSAWQAIESETIRKLKEGGATLVPVSREPFRQKVEPIYRAFTRKYGDGVLREILKAGGGRE